MDCSPQDISILSPTSFDFFAQLNHLETRLLYCSWDVYEWSHALRISGVHVGSWRLWTCGYYVSSYQTQTGREGGTLGQKPVFTHIVLSVKCDGLLMNLHVEGSTLDAVFRYSWTILLCRRCQELTVMWLLSQYSSQHCDVYTYILALVESSSTSFYE
jgi:hypothetical protein